MSDLEDASEEGKKTNIILTYKELSGIHMELQKQGIRLDAMKEDMKDIKEVHVDHEVRIKAIELAYARSTGSSGMAQWATPIILTVVSILFALLNYLKP